MVNTVPEQGEKLMLLHRMDLEELVERGVLIEVVK